MGRFGSILILFLLCLPLAAGSTGVDVSVLVVDGSTPARSPLGGATVALDGTEFTGTSDENGSIYFEAVPPGGYRLVVWADGFRESTQDVEIGEDNWSFEVELQPEE